MPKPKARLISRPEIIWPEVFAYLEEIGAADWFNGKGRDWTENRHEGEDLVELAGRICYRSWKAGLNPNVTRIRDNQTDYINNLLDSEHGCYDDETDVLTVEGWKPWANVNQGDLLATRSRDGFLQYQYAREVLHSRYRGPMYRVESQGVDLLVTPNHNLLVCPTTTKFGRLKQDFNLVRASELGQHSHAYVKTAQALTENALSSDEARLLGFAIGDGNWDGYSLRFHLRKTRKIAWLRSQAAKIGVVVEERGDHFTVGVTPWLRDCVSNMYTPDREKCIPLPIFLLGSKASSALIEGLVESDGHRSDSGVTFDTTSQVLADQVQQLCLHAGCASNVQYVSADRTTSFGSKPLIRLSILARNLTPEVNRSSGSVGRTWTEKDWSGDIHCAEVPNHTLYVRRNGIPVWSGNSVFEHANYTFILYNISRVLTHELVRHRVGVAISQESMRYVRLSNGMQVRDVPELLEDDDWYRQRRAVMHGQCEEFQRDCTEHFNLDAEKSFHRKKAITSSLRDYAPQGVLTAMQWTANVRTLRHIIAQRTNDGAEDEIRILFNLIANLMKDECSLLFGDFTADNKGVWTPSHHKI